MTTYTDAVVVYRLRDNIQVRVPYIGPPITPARLANRVIRDLGPRQYIDVIDYEGDHIVIPVASIVCVEFELATRQ